MRPDERIRDGFNLHGELVALFYKAAFALRFELGGEVFGWDEPVPRLLQAMDRARKVADALFVGGDLTAVIATPQKRDPFPKLLGSEFRKQAIGKPVTAPFFIDDEDPLQDDWTWRTHDLSGAAHFRDGLIWAAITAESPIRPTAFGQIYLVNFEAGLLMHIYDNRGMDVVATRTQPLRALHAQFNGWLLDFDRARMDATFAR